MSFPTVSGADGGGADDSAPYEAGYSGSALEGGARSVTATNGAGLSASSDFTLVPDDSGPTGMSVDLAGGPSFRDGAVSLDVSAGDDAGSGLDAGSLQVERDSAPLGKEGCGAFKGAWQTVKLQKDTDTGVSPGNCYRYRIRVSDNVGNQSVSDPSADAIVEQPEQECVGQPRLEGDCPGTPPPCDADAGKEAVDGSSPEQPATSSSTVVKDGEPDPQCIDEPPSEGDCPADPKPTDPSSDAKGGQTDSECTDKPPIEGDCSGPPPCGADSPKDGADGLRPRSQPPASDAGSSPTSPASDANAVPPDGSPTT